MSGQGWKQNWTSKTNCKLFFTLALDRQQHHPNGQGENQIKTFKNLISLLIVWLACHQFSFFVSRNQQIIAQLFSKTINWLFISENNWSFFCL